MTDLGVTQWVMVGAVFLWSGFVRSGLGFGGVALAMPLMLLIVDDPLLWLPMVAIHLLFFSAVSVFGKTHEIDWNCLGKVLLVVLVPKVIGLLGLLNLSNDVLVPMIYVITFLYGVSYLFDFEFRGGNTLLDNVLLVLGAYASGVSLVGAPLMSAVIARQVAVEKIRTTLFVLWIILVSLKVSTFLVFGIDMQFRYALLLLPVAGIGHWLGLKMHHRLVSGDGKLYKRAMGIALVTVCGYGIAGSMGG